MLKSDSKHEKVLGRAAMVNRINKLVKIKLNNRDQAMKVYRKGIANLKTSQTLMNKYSSRSHTTVIIEAEDNKKSNGF